MLHNHGLLEEGGVFDDHISSRGAMPGHSDECDCWPIHASVIWTSSRLLNVPSVRLVSACDRRELVGADWIILSGSKATSGDLGRLHAYGLDQAVYEGNRSFRLRLRIQ